MEVVTLSTEPKIIKNKNMDTIEFRLIFPIEHNNDNYYYIELLRLILTSTNKWCPSFAAFTKEKLRKMIINIGFFKREQIDTTYLCFTFSTPKEGLIKNFDLESAFKFAMETLFIPFADNEEFDLGKFNYEKDFLLKKHEDYLKGIYRVNNNKFYDIVDPLEALGNTYEHDYEILKNIDNKSLYKFYKKNILEKDFLFYVCGDVNKKRINELYQKYLKPKNKEISFNSNRFKPLKMADFNYQEFNTNFNQSELFLEYQIDIKENEKKYIMAINNILCAQENDLIFDALRIKNNLVYSVRTDSRAARAYLIIDAFIPKDKVNDTKILVEDIFKKLHDKIYMKECFDKLIRALNIDLLKESDNLYNDLEYKINEDLHFTTTKDLIQLFNSIDIDDLLKYLDKYKLTNMVFFRGEE